MWLLINTRRDLTSTKTAEKVYIDLTTPLKASDSEIATFSSVYVIYNSWQSLLTGIAGEKSNTTDELFLFAKERPNILSRHALLNQSKKNMHQEEGSTHAKEYVISLRA